MAALDVMDVECPVRDRDEFVSRRVADVIAAADVAAAGDLIEIGAGIIDDDDDLFAAEEEKAFDESFDEDGAADADADVVDEDDDAVLAAGDAFFELGMKYSTGCAVPADLVAAHKWFNISAMRGNTEAARLRREIAAEMSEREIAEAQRAARDWLAGEGRAAA